MPRREIIDTTSIHDKQQRPLLPGIDKLPFDSVIIPDTLDSRIQTTTCFEVETDYHRCCSTLLHRINRALLTKGIIVQQI